MAKTLKFELVPDASASTRLLGEFLEAWVDLEAELVSTAHDNSITGAQSEKYLSNAWSGRHYALRSFVRCQDPVEQQEDKDQTHR